MTSPRHPLLELTLSRILEFVRDPGAVFWTFGFPIILAVALGIAFREAPPDEARVAVVGDSELATMLEDREGITAMSTTEDDAGPLLVSGKRDLVVVVTDAAPWTYRYDAMRPESRAARLVVDDAIQASRGQSPAVLTRDDHVKESGSRYIDFLVPGLIGLNIMGSAVWGIGFSVVDARKRRLLKRLAATPMARAHFVLSYMFSRLVFLAAEVAALVGFGWLVFDVPIRGSMLSLSIVSIWGALALTGVAMLIAARPTSTEVASGWSNLFMLPMWLLGGSFFPYDRFPESTHVFIQALPLTALNDALRGIINYGEPLWQQWPELAVLGAWGVVCFSLALRWFRWQ